MATSPAIRRVHPEPSLAFEGDKSIRKAAEGLLSSPFESDLPLKTAEPALRFDRAQRFGSESPPLAVAAAPGDPPDARSIEEDDRALYAPPMDPNMVSIQIGEYQQLVAQQQREGRLEEAIVCLGEILRLLDQIPAERRGERYFRETRAYAHRERAVLYHQMANRAANRGTDAGYAEAIRNLALMQADEESKIGLGGSFREIEQYDNQRATLALAEGRWADAVGFLVHLAETVRALENAVSEGRAQDAGFDSPERRVYRTLLCYALAVELAESPEQARIQSERDAFRASLPQGRSLRGVEARVHARVENLRASELAVWRGEAALRAGDRLSAREAFSGAIPIFTQQTQRFFIPPDSDLPGDPYIFQAVSGLRRSSDEALSIEALGQEIRAFWNSLQDFPGRARPSANEEERQALERRALGDIVRFYEDIQSQVRPDSVPDRTETWLALASTQPLVLTRPGGEEFLRLQTFPAEFRAAARRLLDAHLSRQYGEILETGHFAEAIPVWTRARAIFSEVGEAGPLGQVDYHLAIFRNRATAQHTLAPMEEALRAGRAADVSSSLPANWLELIARDVAGRAVETGHWSHLGRAEALWREALVEELKADFIRAGGDVSEAGLEHPAFLFWMENQAAHFGQRFSELMRARNLDAGMALALKTWVMAELLLSRGRVASLSLIGLNLARGFHVWGTLLLDQGRPGEAYATYLGANRVLREIGNSEDLLDATWRAAALAHQLGRQGEVQTLLWQWYIESQMNFSTPDLTGVSEEIRRRWLQILDYLNETRESGEPERFADLRASLQAFFETPLSEAKLGEMRETLATEWQLLSEFPHYPVRSSQAIAEGEAALRRGDPLEALSYALPGATVRIPDRLSRLIDGAIVEMASRPETEIANDVLARALELAADAYIDARDFNRALFYTIEAARCCDGGVPGESVRALFERIQKESATTPQEQVPIQNLYIELWNEARARDARSPLPAVLGFLHLERFLYRHKGQIHTPAEAEEFIAYYRWSQGNISREVALHQLSSFVSEDVPHPFRSGGSHGESPHVILNPLLRIPNAIKMYAIAQRVPLEEELGNRPSVPPSPPVNLPRETLIEELTGVEDWISRKSLEEAHGVGSRHGIDVEGYLNARFSDGRDLVSRGTLIEDALGEASPHRPAAQFLVGVLLANMRRVVPAECQVRWPSAVFDGLREMVIEQRRVTRAQNSETPGSREDRPDDRRGPNPVDPKRGGPAGR